MQTKTRSSKLINQKNNLIIILLHLKSLLTIDTSIVFFCFYESTMYIWNIITLVLSTAFTLFVMFD